MSASKSYQLLCTGDLHLGRYPSRIPPNERALSVARVWEAVVEYAITQGVDALALTGDVVDRDNRFFESYGPLSRGLRRLADAGIDTVAVAGNHDFDVFPHLVATLDADRFHLLGRGGTWDVVPLKRAGETVLRCVGWSFPDSHVRSSPVAELDLPRAAVPTIGLLHADLDQPDSGYAPVTRSALAAHPVDAWLLGHIHAPTCYDEAEPFILYPGSPQPLDPGEPGAHGPWRVEVSAQGVVTAEQVPLASVRYDTVDVDLGGVGDDAAFRSAVVDAVEEAASRHARHDALRHLAYRLHCTGRTPIHRQIDALWDEVRDLEVAAGRATATVDALIADTRPDVDLEALAERADPPGVLARTILDLQQKTGRHEALLRQTQQALEQLGRARKYRALRHVHPASPSDRRDDARAVLIRQGLQLLDELLAQKVIPTDA